MITVDCSNALAIKDRLLVYVADKLKAMPILKSDKFILDPIDDKIIEKADVIFAIEEFLDSLDIKESFQIIPNDDEITMKQIEGKYVAEKKENISEVDSNPFFECTHCGFMTIYEEELKTHRLIHYL